MQKETPNISRSPREKNPHVVSILDYTRPMKASLVIADFLKHKGVPCVFEVVGGMITHILDALHNRQIPIISMHHEQGAAFAADAVGRMTGVPGVAMATSGPGATNLLTGIGSCFFDSSPAVFLTGQVNRYELKGDRAIRQLGFQEADIVSMAAPITKAAWQVKEATDVLPSLERAFAIASDGRPGPVLVDIPMDLQRSDIPAWIASPELVQTEKPLALDDVWKHLLVASRPLLLVGNGVRAAGAAELCARFVEHTGIPVVHSLLGLDVLPRSHPLSIGMIGAYGNRWANLAVGRSDCIIVLGSRLDIRQTGADTVSWKGNRMIMHIDCNPAEINSRILGCTPVVSDVHGFLVQALRDCPQTQAHKYSGWLEEIRALRTQWPDTLELQNVQGIHPNVFMHELSQHARNAAAYVVDVGQHQMWAAQSLELRAGQRFLTSGGMGAMGFSLPAAIGTALVSRPHPVVVIAGDGSFQLNIQELQTVVRNRLPLKIVILHNHCHGMVRQFQETYFEKRYQSTVWGYSAPDFARIAEAYGIQARTLTDPSETDELLRWLWTDPAKPQLLQVMIDPQLNVYPKIAFGRPMTEMEPHAKPIEQEGT
ncbi:MAG: acetolactate synthase I/II/III large subunit [Candidatus Peregrinibacteria bacterium Greene1014_49]|nr:MAG: acetolactate synthase I/II/III large subunit [Candidatus Peregrinibacteria bacterium Greene1014_49]